MRKKLHILIIDDSETKFQLLSHIIRKGNQDIECRRVESEPEMNLALSDNKWDLFLSDCHMPLFSAQAALKIYNTHGLHSPFILVSGAIGEEEAISLLKAGAKDFVNKDNLNRLLPTIERCFMEADEYKKRKEAEEALRNSEEQFRSISESASDAIIATDEYGLVTVWNHSAQVIFGYTKKEILGQPVACLVPEADWNILKLELQHCIEVKKPPSNSCVKELHGLKKNGVVFPVEISLSSWAIKGLSRYSAIVRDITQRRQVDENRVMLQQQSIRSGQLATIGVLAAGVAHEVNNPNNSIQFNTAMLRDVWLDAVPFLERAKLEEGEFLLAGVPISDVLDTMPRLFDGIKKSSLRIQNIIQNLKHLSRQDKGVLDQDINISTVIADSISILQSQIKKYCNNFSSDLPEILPVVQGNTQQLEQVFINLILNALQALGNRNKHVKVTITEDKSSNSVMVKVVDEGKGICEKNLQFLIDPFFTTRTDVGGTGLGLSISNTIIQNHGGQITFESELGKGTTVTVQLPINYVK
ncbi:MAG: PAS domain S-box protein [Magnetococcales bacterium]|nr:PAS domain S-box protein [Magnetococcales bacterium]